MATLSLFRTEVSSVLGLDNSTSGDQTLIDQWVNEGVVDVVLRSSCKVQPFTMTLTSGQRDYTLPTAILTMVDLYVSSSTTQYSMERVTPSELLQYRRADNSTSTSPVRLFATDGANILMVYPTPSQADTLTGIYVPRPTTLSGASDTPSEIPSEWHKLVVYYALFRGADFDDDASSQMGERYRALYEEGLREMRKHLLRKGSHRLPPLRVNRRNRMLVPHDRSTDLG